MGLVGRKGIGLGQPISLGARGGQGQGVGMGEEERPRAAYKYSGGGLGGRPGRARGLAEELAQGYTQGYTQGHFDPTQCVPLAQPEAVTVPQGPSLYQKASEARLPLAPPGAAAAPLTPSLYPKSLGHQPSLYEPSVSQYRAPVAGATEGLKAVQSLPRGLENSEVCPVLTSLGPLLRGEVPRGHTGPGAPLRREASMGYTSQGDTGSSRDSGVQTWPETAVPQHRLAQALGRGSLTRGGEGQRNGRGLGYSDTRDGFVNSDREEREGGVCP